MSQADPGHVAPLSADDFCCPKCGHGEWRTVNASDPFEAWEGSCANCRFRWPRKDDALYFKPSRERERIAWARFVKATAEERDNSAATKRDIPGAEAWSSRAAFWKEQHTKATAELAAAKQALRGFGVDVDSLLSEAHPPPAPERTS